MKLLKLIIFLFFILIVFHIRDAAAENRAGAVSVSPFIGGYIFDSDQFIKSDPAYGIVLGYNITERIGIEGAFNYVDTEVRFSTRSNRVDAYVYRLEGLYHFMADKDVLPYVAVGAGAITIDMDGVGNATAFLVNYGGGIKFFLTESLAFRAGIRHIISSDKKYNDILYTLGLSYFIGAKAKKEAPKPMPMDGDGDGIPDDMDKCVDTPAGVQIDGSGCPLDSDGDGVYDDKDQCTRTPLGAVVDSTGCPLDNDRDGVYDYKDNCSGTPSGASVDSTGCPLDSDKDGVHDFIDKCSGTAVGIKVDAAGCPLPIKEKVSIEMNVEFVSNSAIVKNVFHDHMEKVSNFLKTYPDAIAVIEGHTDSRGDDEDNLKLSQRRAENVMRHLVDYGIHPSRLKAEGYGEYRPIADNSTAEGRQKNRRVVAFISITTLKKPVIEQEDPIMINDKAPSNKYKETQTIDNKSIIKETSDEENKLNGKLKVDDQYASQLVYTIQTGSFLEIELAQKQFNSVVQVLNAKEIDYLRIEKVGNYYTVRLGKFLDYASVKGFLQDIKPQLSEAVILKAHIKNERLIRLYE